jgi:mRNA-degrading endonuclease RelE of RelBE toxin-antitoxin system
MAPPQPFTVIYAPLIRIHLRVIEAKYYARMRTTIEQRLSYDPHVQTPHRQPLKRPVFFEATWEFRFGAGNRFRVFYDIDQKRHIVAILAIGIKRGNRLLIGDEEIPL